MSTTYLITAASGIGAETARELARASRASDLVQIFFSSLVNDPCPALKEELQSLGAVADYLVGDLTSLPFASQLVSACIDRFSRVDALFNVAGVSGRRFGDGPAHQCTDEGWQKTIDTNLSTQFRMCREVTLEMLKHEPRNGLRGTILNMSSILALHPEPTYFDTVAYAASKGAIISMSRTMAASYRSARIRVNAVAPGLVATPMSARASQDPEVLDFIRKKQLLVEDVIAVKDVARACAFLLTDASHAITGQCLEVDAGWGLS
jgi:NAD(P)-dependent dehydrogenase (short-subunit alcohol dehydrogenase family)